MNYTEQSRNVNGWILNKMGIRKSDGKELWKAKKGEVAVIGSRQEVINLIKEIEK